MAGGRVFSIPPSAPFLKILAQALCDGRLVDGFKLDPTDPLSLARATIYVPTRRAARVFRSEFVDIMGGRSAILPVIRPLGETDDDAGYFDEIDAGSLDLLPPVSATTRLVELARLILVWRNRLPDMLRDIHSDSPLVAPASPADAIWLARSLTELIESVETEDVGWDRLKTIDLGDRALWWQLTGEFLKIASHYWPERLVELHRSSPSLHRNDAIRAEARRVEAMGTTHPMIVAGSTGSIPATSDLIAAIHRLDCGAIVLPGLDLRMSEANWLMAGAVSAAGRKNTDPASRSHPQYGLFHLLQKLQTLRADVVELSEETTEMRVRSEAASIAFAPADAEVNHRIWRERVGSSQIEAAFSNMTQIEAANEREEALAIAIVLKLALHAPGTDEKTQVALITPDRTLARRVTAELQRFGIEADDSAGTPLSSSLHGALITLTLEAILRPGDPVALVSLLKHPLVRLGYPRDELETIAGRLELLCLRGGTALANPASLKTVVLSAMHGFDENPFRKVWQRRLLAEPPWNVLIALAERVERAVEPLARVIVQENGKQFSSKAPLGSWAEATGRVLEALAVDERGSLESLWSGEAGEALAGLLREIMETGDTLEADGPQWIDAATALVSGVGIKPKPMNHPRVFIWGTLEARLQAVDTLVLGGMNEATWPMQTANNPFLSRVMKTEMGLEPPERRIGQSAHDFVMGLGTKNLVMTRALRQGGAPSVASRFLQRLLSAAGEETASALRSRGEEYLRLAAAVDDGESQDFSPRPDPRPAAAIQPVKYSFSEAGTLRRDPYAIYARHILKIEAITPYNEDPGALERGNIYHAIVDRFVRGGHDPRNETALETISGIAHDVFDAALLPAHIDAVWQPRFLDTAKAFLEAEAARRPDIRSTHTEISARLQIAEDLAISGRADRIDVRKDGKADIIDYKTGLTPSVKEARSLLDPQLSLEAAALKGGGFPDLKAMETDNPLYVRLRPGKNFKTEAVNNDKSSRTKPDDVRTADALAQEALRQLIKLTTALKRGDTGFKSRVAPFRDRDHGGAYDHLARVAEWSSADPDGEGEDE